MRKQHHFLIVCFPSQGNINPSLQLAKRLINLKNDIEVTFATTVAAARRMSKTPATKGLSFATYSDGFDDESFKPADGNFSHFFSEFKRCGSQSVRDLISSAANRGRPFSFVIYSLMLDWMVDIAAAFGIRSALFFAQPATVLALYFYYFHGYADDTISNQQYNSIHHLQLPGLPLLTSGDMPSFFSPSGPHAFIIPPMRDQFNVLDQQTQPTVLINTFDALEPQALQAIDKLKMLAIGPLVPSGNDASSLRGDLFQASTEDYIGWLNSKAESSVVYVSFGSICVLSEQQEEELLHGLLESGHPFLWVMRSNNNEEKFNKLVEGKGKIVCWCCQIDVLSHSSLGCFVTHCGWNSTIEGLALGVPMVGFPMQIDQPTNGKLVEDVWKSGVRVKANSEGIVERGEIRECLDLVMGSKDIGKKEEIMKNAEKWKQLARQAIDEGGSSNLNLRAFVDGIEGGA